MARPVAELVRERLTVLGDTIPMAGFLFATKLDYDGGALVPKRLDGARTARVLERALDLVDAACGPDEDPAEQAFRTAADELGVKFGDLMMPVRVAITGARVSPPLFGSMRILGAETCRDRLRAALVKLDEQTPDA